MEARKRNPASTPLKGEDITTSHWQDARHWMSIYRDLLRFKRGLLARVEKELPALDPIAQGAASEDLKIIEEQLEGYLARLDLWYLRLWELQGLYLDPETSMVRHKGTETHLTKREFQLLKFLIDHPHRFFSAERILAQAWGDPELFPEEVRNYVRRPRKILAVLAIPCDLINRPGRGYSLVFRND